MFARWQDSHRCTSRDTHTMLSPFSIKYSSSPSDCWVTTDLTAVFWILSFKHPGPFFINQNRPEAIQVIYKASPNSENLHSQFSHHPGMSQPHIWFPRFFYVTRRKATETPSQRRRRRLASLKRRQGGSERFLPPPSTTW